MRANSALMPNTSGRALPDADRFHLTVEFHGEQPRRNDIGADPQPIETTATTLVIHSRRRALSP
jgi:hypothetical protein